MAAWSLRRRTEPTVGAEIIWLHGEIDLSNALEVRERLSEMGTNGHNLVLDLDGLSFIDISGVRALEVLSTTCRIAGVLLLVVCSSAPIRRILDILGLHAAVPILNTRSAAIHHLRANGLTP